MHAHFDSNDAAAVRRYLFVKLRELAEFRLKKTVVDASEQSPEKKKEEADILFRKECDRTKDILLLLFRYRTLSPNWEMFADEGKLLYECRRNLVFLGDSKELVAQVLSQNLRAIVRALPYDYNEEYSPPSKAEARVS